MQSSSKTGAALPAMIEATVAALIRTGVHPSQINYDPFLAM